MKKLITAVLLGCFCATACYNSFTINNDELKKLQAGNDAEYIQIAAESGETIEVSGGNPLTVITSDTSEYHITPFNFILSETQLVAPDYDLLLASDQLVNAEVKEISYGKTFGLVGGIMAVTIGLFVGISLIAGNGSGMSGN